MRGIYLKLCTKIVFKYELFTVDGVGVGNRKMCLSGDKGITYR